jgi:hypothetical protein
MKTYMSRRDRCADSGDRRQKIAGGTDVAMLAAMRCRLLVPILLVAACDDQGAHLTLHAAAGPVKAEAFEIVLASPDLVPVIDNQRVSPTAFTNETVTYYLQRTTAGGIATGKIDAVDGFTVQVEPGAGITDKAFIPFVVLYDQDEHVVGMGTFHADDQSPPSPILVPRGKVDLYPIEVESVTEVTDRHAVDAQQAMQVDCTRADQTTWRSGLVWRPKSGGELRLMFPDDPSSDDATGRALDMDCDDHVVAPGDSGPDCDDTRERFHRGAEEVCDDEDTNCDGVPYVVVPCTASNICSSPTSTMGYALCDDTTGVQASCQSDVSCLCGTGASTTGCARCLIDYAAAMTVGDIAPCQPGIGVLAAPTFCAQQTPCNVVVVGARGGWDAEVARTPQDPFAVGASGVIGSFALKAKRPGGPGDELPRAPSLGAVDLVIVDAGGISHLQSVDLEANGDAPVTCTGGGPFSMHCSP